ncbi:MAG: hypothetical protein NVS2B15_12250 [Pseudarthrobacter sp.]
MAFAAGADDFEGYFSYGSRDAQLGHAVRGVQHLITDWHEGLQFGSEQVQSAIAGPAQKSVIDSRDVAAVVGGQVSAGCLMEQRFEIRLWPVTGPCHALPRYFRTAAAVSAGALTCGQCPVA